MSYTDIMAEELQKAARKYALACHAEKVENENTALANKVEALERKIEEQKDEIDTLRELIGDLNRENDRVWNENINLSDRLKNLTRVLLKNFYITAEWDKQRSVWCLKLNDDGRKRHDLGIEVDE